MALLVIRRRTLARQDARRGALLPCLPPLLPLLSLLLPPALSLQRFHR
jgi:hypothetical protein